MKKGPLVGWVIHGDDKLPSYIGIIINHEIRIPSLTIQDSMESRSVFFVAQMDVPKNRGGFFTPQNGW